MPYGYLILENDKGETDSVNNFIGLGDGIPAAILLPITIGWLTAAYTKKWYNQLIGPNIFQHPLSEQSIFLSDILGNLDKLGLIKKYSKLLKFKLDGHNQVENLVEITNPETNSISFTQKNNTPERILLINQYYQKACEKLLTAKTAQNHSLPNNRYSLFSTLCAPEDKQNQRVLCPITQCSIVEPVSIEGEGKAYERSSIIAWYRKNKSSPYGFRISKDKTIEQCLITGFPVEEQIIINPRLSRC